MRLKPQTREFSLCAEDIDHFSDWLEDVQVGIGMQRRDRLRVRIYLEEVLLRMRDRFGEELTVSATCETSFGVPRLRIESVSEPFNPIGMGSDDLGSWESSLGMAIGLAPQYTHEGGVNTLRLRLPVAGMNPVVRIAIAIGLGALLGLVGTLAMPGEGRRAIAAVIITPLYQIWIRLLNAISGPVIFFTVATAVLNVRTIHARGGSSLRVIVRYFVLSILAVAGSLAAALVMFPLGYTDVLQDKRLFAELIEHLPELVPSNITEPFVNSNTAQLLLMAFSLGYILEMLGDRTESLKTIVRESNVVGLKIAEWMSWFVPIVSGAFVCLELWQARTSLLVNMWQPLVLSLFLSALVIVAIEVVMAWRLGMSPLLLFRKLWEPFWLSLKKGSLNESFNVAQDTCTRLLGIDQDYVRVALPQGLVLYMPVSAIGTIVFTLFVARAYGMQGTPFWYVIAIVMAVVVFVATPPVPGANLLAYVVLFSTLGIPSDALLDAMIYDILFGIFASAANQTMLQLEMVQQSRRFGLLDAKVLQRPMAR